MRLSETQFDDAVPVDSYGPGFFRIAGEVHEGPLLLLGSAPLAWAGDVDALLALTGRVDVLFYGTGVEMAPLPPDVRAALDKTSLAVEPMATPSACRTYNVLLSEGRRVALAALPV